MPAPEITWQMVVNIAPAMANVPAPAQTEILSFVAGEVHYDVWGEQFVPGSVYLAAHLGTLAGPGLWAGGAGPVTSRSAGGIAQSYASMLQFGQLGLSAFGVEFSRRQRLLIANFAGIVT